MGVKLHKTGKSNWDVYKDNDKIGSVNRVGRRKWMKISTKLFAFDSISVSHKTRQSAIKDLAAEYDLVVKYNKEFFERWKEMCSNDNWKVLERSLAILNSGFKRKMTP